VFKNTSFGKSIALSSRVKQQEEASVPIDLEEDGPDHKEATRREISKIFGDDIETTLRAGVDTLSANKKRQDLISFLD